MDYYKALWGLSSFTVLCNNPCSGQHVVHLSSEILRKHTNVERLTRSNADLVALYASGVYCLDSKPVIYVVRMEFTFSLGRWSVLINIAKCGGVSCVVALVYTGCGALFLIETINLIILFSIANGVATGDWCTRVWICREVS
jgi:hypothetical protein